MKKIFILFVFLLTLDGLFFYHALRFGVDVTAMEHGTLENIHALINLGCMMLLLYCLVVAGPNPRLVFFALALLFLTFFLREVDVEDLELPAWMIFIGSGVGRNVLLSASWCVVLAFSLRHTRFYASIAMGLLRSPIGALFFRRGDIPVRRQLIRGKSVEHRILSAVRGSAGAERLLPAAACLKHHFKDSA